MDAVAQDIKDQTLWVIANMERSAEQALRQAAEQKKSGWAVMSDLAAMYGEQKALRYRKNLVKELGYGLPAAEAVAALLERVEDDIMSWNSSKSSNGCANVISDEEHAALMSLAKELRSSLKHIARSAAVEAGLGTGVLTNQQQ